MRFQRFCEILLQLSGRWQTLFDRYHGQRFRMRLLILSIAALCLVVVIYSLGGRKKPSLVVDSQPEEAMVILDGEPLGVTPLKVRKRLSGRLSLRVQKEGYMSEEHVLRFEPEQPIKLFFDLKPAGILRIDSYPNGAAVVFDEQPAGNTPLIMTDVLPGNHMVLLEREGYQPHRERVDIIALKEKKLRVHLKKLTGEVRLNTQPSGVEVWIGRQQKGITPLTLSDLDDGPLKILLKSDCSPPLLRTVDVLPGRSVTLDIKMTSQCRRAIIKSRPGSVTVFLNDKKKGRTPLVLETVRAGDRLVLKRKDYLDWEKVLEFEEEKMEIEVDAKLSYRFKPGALWREPKTGMEFVLMAEGCYRMGSPSDEFGRYANEEPRHRVCLDLFWMGRTEVSNRQYRLFKSAHDSKVFRHHSLDKSTQPAVFVSWHDAKRFAEWMTKQDTNGYRYRLPSEAQWEYACRAGRSSARFWGTSSEEACRYANVLDLTLAQISEGQSDVHPCSDHHLVTAPVGSLKANRYQLFDMLGNVWEWCEDLYRDDAYRVHSLWNPLNQKRGKNRVIRGGSFNSPVNMVRSACRDNYRSTLRTAELGFRLIRLP